MIGGTEVAWKDGRWLLRVHLLAVGVDKADWSRLRSRWPRLGVAIPINSEIATASSRTSRSSRHITVPAREDSADPESHTLLLPAQLAELIAWWSRYRFADLLFAYGARRRGTHIVVDG